MLDEHCTTPTIEHIKSNSDPESWFISSASEPCCCNGAIRGAFYSRRRRDLNRRWLRKILATLRSFS
jgi:hypothetical protein